MLNLFLMLQAVSTGAEAATEAVAESAAAVEKITIFDMALKGGWIMLVLLLGLILALYIFIERFLALRNALRAESDNAFMNNIRQYIHSGNIDGARQLSKQTHTPIGRMIDKGLSRLGRPLPDIQAAIENVGQLEVATLEKRVSLVATIASLGSMLGFLGTVTGMVTAFQDMAHAGNNIEIGILATGIYEAMVTTVGGLIVGIIAYFLYNVLVTQINKVVNTLESRATEFMDLLHEPA
ncbi:MAG: MotA/TolQ/ExbB proton channel family protein [Bacteroidales bacterium]|nr:MotA/TolQ/ExbB proton channel family protein [Bacteroidales bacterium]